MNSRRKPAQRQEPAILRRGKAFERIEKKEWLAPDRAESHFERVLKLTTGRRGRMDIFLEEVGGFVSILEAKSTNWDRILPHRHRPNLLRHARQVIGYVRALVEEGLEVCPGLVYPEAPINQETRERVEQTLNEQGIQVIWANERTADQ